jgi:hypothetical protein
VAVLTGISPVLLLADLDRSVACYRERLGFECDVHGEPTGTTSRLVSGSAEAAR